MKVFLLIITLVFLQIQTAAAQKQQPGRQDVYLWTNNDWKLSHSLGFLYDQSGRLLSKTTISGTTGETMAIDSTSYDRFGNIVATGFYQRKNGAWELLAGKRSQISYDTQHPGKASQRIDEIFTNGEWKIDGKFTFAYTAGGMMKQRVNLAWINDSWVEAARITVNYDDTGKISDALLEFTKNGEWVPDQRMTELTGIFSETEIPDTYIMEGSADGRWANTDKRTKEILDPNGSFRDSRYKWVEGEWLLVWRATEMFDEFGSRTFEEREEHTDSGFRLSDRSRHQLSYEEGRLVEDIADAWDVQHSRYIRSLRNVYSDFRTVSPVIEESAEKSFPVYPNPANDELSIRLPGVEGPLTVEISEADGRLVRRNLVSASGEYCRFDISSLAPGPYTIRYYSGGRQFSAKFIRN